MTEPFRRRPQPREPSPASLDAFLTGAESPAPLPAREPPPSPWAQGRPDVIKTYVLRLPEPQDALFRLTRGTVATIPTEPVPDERSNAS